MSGKLPARVTRTVSESPDVTVTCPPTGSSSVMAVRVAMPEVVNGL